MDFPTSMAIEAGRPTGRQLYGFRTAKIAQEFADRIRAGDLKHTTDFAIMRMGDAVKVAPNSHRSRSQLDDACVALGGTLPRRLYGELTKAFVTGDKLAMAEVAAHAAGIQILDRMRDLTSAPRAVWILELCGEATALKAWRDEYAVGLKP